MSCFAGELLQLQRLCESAHVAVGGPSWWLEFMVDAVSFASNAGAVNIDSTSCWFASQVGLRVMLWMARMLGLLLAALP